MPQGILEFSVKFYCSEAESITDFKNRVESFFLNCHDKNLEHNVQFGSITKTGSAFAYSENIYVLNCTLSYPNVTTDADLDVPVSEVCRKWCDQTQNTTFLYWLKPIRNERFYYEENRYDRLMKSVGFAFGTMPDMENFVQHYHYEQRCRESEIMTSFYHSQRYFLVYFAPTHKYSCTADKFVYVFKIMYTSLSRVIVNIASGESPTELYFMLRYPPEINVRVQNAADAYSPSVYALSVASQCEYNPDKYERALKIGCTCKHFCYDLKRFGKSPVFKLVISDSFRVRHVIHRMIERCNVETEFFYSRIHTKVKDFTCLKKIEDFSIFTNTFQRDLNYSELFSCQYAWKSIFCYSWLVRDQILLTDDPESEARVIKNKIRQHAISNCKALCKTLFSISAMIENHTIFFFHSAMDELFQVFCNSEDYSDIMPDGMCFVRRLIITPLRTIYLPPTEHFNNRVIRKFGCEYMLRLSFMDDNYGNLSFFVQNHTRKEEFMEVVVKKALQNGLEIGCRHYEVLASSNSQLRGHGMWLFAKDNLGNIASDVRKWMGDFSQLKNVAKYMARMGQCFSSSEEAVQLTLCSTDEIHLNDIKTINGRFIFSDGIGKISPELAHEVRQAMKKNSNFQTAISDYKPCAFQIRYKGCKGMVVEDVNMVGRIFAVRPSMRKFECTTSSNLEIVKVSAPRQLFLSRHLITILEQKRTPCNVFLKLEKRMIIEFLDSLFYSSNATAVLHQFSNLCIPYSDLANTGFNFMTDAFFHSLLLSIYRSSVDLLRQKCRIAVPVAYGRNMFGVLDETRTLKYGEVFVQYSENVGFTKSDLKIVEGTVMVTKNPCMHPGDVRKFKAVDVPGLRHIKDCIVFPCCGKRPHPDEMSGSDLDGDEFVVIWDPDLIFPDSNSPPMEYPVYNERMTAGNINVQDMIEFFCDYIMNDNIGSFGNAFLAWADQNPYGIFSRTCLSIAKKYPYVLDFAKTGKTQRLGVNEKPRQYPDFMEKGSLNNSYYSTRALGILYRTTRQLKESVNRINTLKPTFDFDPYLSYPGWEEYAKTAKTHKSAYDFHVERILQKFCIKNEADAFSGHFQSNMYSLNRYEKSNMASVVRTYLTDLMHKYRLKFFEDSNVEFIEKEINSIEQRELCLYRRASAWYMVVYTSGESKVWSMPWTISDILSKVRKKCMEFNEQVILTDGFFLKNVEKIVEASIPRNKSNTLNINDSSFQLAREILELWVKKPGLIINKCHQEKCECFSRIFDIFLSSHTSRGTGYAVGSAENSSLKIVVDFLKFVFCYSPATTDRCCITLQSASLETLSNLAITHNVRYLGIDYKKSNEDHTDDDEHNLEEGDTIRISVRTEKNKEFLQNNMEWMKTYLIETSGVKKISINTDCDRQENWFLLINSFGRSWQRHHLADIMLNKNFIPNLQKIIDNSSKK